MVIRDTHLGQRIAQRSLAEAALPGDRGQPHVNQPRHPTISEVSDEPSNLAPFLTHPEHPARLRDHHAVTLSRPRATRSGNASQPVTVPAGLDKLDDQIR